MMEKEKLTDGDIVCQEIIKEGMPTDPCLKCAPEKREVCTGCQEKDDYYIRTQAYLTAKNHETYRAGKSMIDKLDDMLDSVNELQSLMDELPKEIRDAVDPKGLFASDKSDSKEDKPTNPLILAALKGAAKK